MKVNRQPRYHPTRRAQVALVVAVCLAVASHLRAQSAITWDAPLTISSDSDVRTDGSLFGAINNGGKGAFSVTVNGVRFLQFATPGNTQSVSVGDFTLTADTQSELVGYDHRGPTGAGMSQEYSALVGANSVAYGSTPDIGTPAKMVLTVSNLEVGQAYLIQIWVNWSVAAGDSTMGNTSRSTTTLSAKNSVTLHPNTTGTVGGRGQFTTGRFTATEVTQSVEVTGATSDSTANLTVGVISAVQVRTAATAAPSPSKLVNISTRSRVEVGENALIGGFIIQGQTSKRVIVRAIGPSLARSGVVGVLENPTLVLFDGTGNPIAENDDWRSTQQDEIAATGVPPTDDRESAIVASISAGNYTAIVRGKNDTSGVALVEVYDLQ